jgi:hypothetical protein
VANLVSPLLQTGLGIAVSVLLFLVGYRQTIGAKKERVRAGNIQLRRTILRRLVLEDYEPVRDDVARLIAGKARDLGLAAEDLLAPEDLLTEAYAEVFESDLIESAKRSLIEQRLANSLKTQRPSADQLEREVDSSGSIARANRLLLPMAVATAAFGTLVSVLPQATAGALLDSQTLQVAALGFLASIGAMAAYFVIRRQRDVTQAPGRSLFQKNAEFEAAVARKLVKGKARVSFGVAQPGQVDFIASIGSRRLAVEAKSWKGRIPAVLVAQAVSKLEEALRAEVATDAVLVVPDDANPPVGALGGSRVALVRLGSLDKYLAQLQ